MSSCQRQQEQLDRFYCLRAVVVLSHARNIKNKHLGMRATLSEGMEIDESFCPGVT